MLSIAGKHGCWLQLYDSGSGSGFGFFGVVHPAQLVQERQQKGQGDDKGEHIRNGLAGLHAHESQCAGQDEDEREEFSAQKSFGMEDIDE